MKLTHILTGLAAAAVIAAVTIPALATDTPAFGNVDGDNAITSTDARLVLQYYAKKIDASALNTALADVDGDHEVTSTDARLILQYYAKKIDHFPIEDIVPTSTATETPTSATETPTSATETETSATETETSVTETETSVTETETVPTETQTTGSTTMTTGKAKPEDPGITLPPVPFG